MNPEIGMKWIQEVPEYKKFYIYFKSPQFKQSLSSVVCSGCNSCDSWGAIHSLMQSCCHTMETEWDPHNHSLPHEGISQVEFNLVGEWTWTVLYKLLWWEGGCVQGRGQEQRQTPEQIHGASNKCQMCSVPTGIAKDSDGLVWREVFFHSRTEARTDDLSLTN